jgi:hypothetical protein
MNVNVTFEQVRQRAYELWLQDGMSPGRDLDHWFAAERELMDESAGTTAALARAERKAPAKKNSRKKK